MHGVYVDAKRFFVETSTKYFNRVDLEIVSTVGCQTNNTFESSNLENNWKIRIREAGLIEGRRADDVHPKTRFLPSYSSMWTHYSSACGVLRHRVAKTIVYLSHLRDACVVQRFRRMFANLFGTFHCVIDELNISMKRFADDSSLLRALPIP